MSLCQSCETAPGTPTTKALNGLPLGVIACDECREAVKRREVGVVIRRPGDGSLYITDGRPGRPHHHSSQESEGAPMSGHAAVAERFEQVPISLIFESKKNPRTTFSDERLKELAASIAEKGIIEPLVIRPNGKPGAFEVVAGARRLRAAGIAGLAAVPAVIREYSDDQVLELMLIENVQRTDLSPLEQAVGYRKLIDSNPTKHSAESIATRIGMSPAWVWDRLKLNDLVKDAKALLEAERMTVGHAILIARLKPSDQERAIAPGNTKGYGAASDPGGLWRTHRSFFDDDVDRDERKAAKDRWAGLKPRTVRELEQWIQDHVRFDVAHAAKAQPLEFGELPATIEAAEQTPGRGRKVVAITHDYRVKDDARDEAERTYGSESWERADGQEKSRTCEHSVLGVVVAGEGQGSTLRVCVARDKCLVHFGQIVRAKQKAEKQRAAGKGKQAARTEQKAEERAREKRAREEAAREAEEKTWSAMLPNLRTKIVAHLKAVKFGAKQLGIIDRHMFPGYMDLAPVKDVEHEFKVKLSDKTASLVLALMAVDLNHEHAAETTLSPWGFSLSKFKTEFAKSHPVEQDSKPAKAKKA